MSESANNAVFLSYASQNALAVERIAGTLRAAGVEVWFDQNELVVCDARDQEIRRLSRFMRCALVQTSRCCATARISKRYSTTRK